MKELIVKPVGKEDLEQLGKWLNANIDKNGLDPDIFTYPALEWMKASRNGEVIAYLPVHPVAVIESLAPNPQCQNGDLAHALKQMVTVIAFTAYTKGARELYFMGSSKETNDFAERHGFEKVETPVYRMRLTK